VKYFSTRLPMESTIRTGPENKKDTDKIEDGFDEYEHKNGKECGSG